MLRFAANRGLGHAFAAGIDYCLHAGADIIVNTDGDNQYFGGDIPKLVAPILAGNADLVIGDREPTKVKHFSFVKKTLQVVGSRVISRLAGLDVPDVASGFKAYSREAAMRLAMSTDFDHTVDHVIQAGRKRIPTVSVPIRTNDKLHIAVRVYSTYGAMAIFSALGAATIMAGVTLGARFIYYFLFTDSSDLHVQSLILAAILMLAGFQMVLTGIVADLISSSRGILEEVSYRLRRVESPEKKDRTDDA